MKLKPTLLVALLISISFLCKSQSITSARFTISDYKKGIRYIELLIDDNLIVEIDARGSICYVKDLKTGFTNEKSDFNRKIESVSNLPVTYYDQFDIHDPQGKIKSIGKIKFSYYNVFDIHDEFGGLKTIDDIKIEYNNVFDITSPKGKVKSIGKVKIDYYAKFDTEDSLVKIQSIEGNTDYISVSKFKEEN